MQSVSLSMTAMGSYILDAIKLTASFSLFSPAWKFIHFWAFTDPSFGAYMFTKSG